MNKEEVEQRLKEVKEELKDYKGYVQVRKYERARTEKKQLKKQLKEIPSLEVGKWYKSVGTYLIYCVTEINGDWVVGYGFENGKWVTSKETNNKEECWFDLSEDRSRWVVPATDKEVETALIKEAKRRGFDNSDSDYRNRVFVKGLNGLDEHLGIDWVYDSGVLYTIGTGLIEIFKDGKWAEIIEQPKTVSLNGDYTKIQLTDIINNRFNDER